jgi:diguanylate cyclase (GGDEF)-like protein
MKEAGQNSGIEQTVLIVDDEKINRVLLGKAFADHYAIREATDGKQALSLLRAHEDIVAVVLDINMPGMNGFDVLERMQRSRRMREIPVIVITANEDTQTQLRALSTGAIDVVFKPFNPLIVRQRVSNQISRMNALRLAQKATETERSLKKAETDAVSGLYNKVGFLRRAATLLNQEPNGKYILVRWDIDNFKVFNDTFGLKGGDEYLHRVGQRYLKRQNTGDGPCLTCRYEADHFAYLTLAENFDPQEELQKLKQVVRLPKKTPFKVTIRMGLYPVTDTRVEVSLMCDRALMALRSTKESFKKNYAWFEESMRDDMLAEQRIVGSMEKALQNREFQIYLQPQYNHETHAMMGAEALVRWVKPDGTMMPPNDFIPIFEKNGFIFELDYYIWEKTCALLRQWLDMDMARIPVSVNVSRYDVMQPSFTKRLLGLVKKYKLPVELLRLEITESAFAHNTAYLIKVVEELREAGFLIEIDDFGSGYLSFNTLKDVPADILKLDMRFLQGETHMRRGGTILESVVRMAHWLHMLVIAEGVETAQQADFLKSIGCVCIQGYYYSRPVPVDAFERLMTESAQTADVPAIQTAKGMSSTAFWNPASIDSLIFSSYVGPACVMESQNGHLQIIRANDGFREALRTTRTIGEILNSDIFVHTTPECAELFRDALEKAQKVGDSFTGVFPVTVSHDGPKHTEYLRYVGHIVAKSDRYSIAYLLVENITEQHLTEERAREMTGQLALLNDISRDLLYQTNVENALHSALSKMLTYFDGERIYVFEFNEAKRTADNTYELCAPGVVPQQAALQGVPLDTVAYWIDAFQHQPHLYVNVDELGSNRENERAILARQGIRALIAVPIWEDGTLTGFLAWMIPSRIQDM